MKFAISILILFFFPSPCTAQTDDTFRFVVMGCTHFGVCDFNYFDQASEAMKTYKPDFILFLGGMIDPGSARPIKDLLQEFDNKTKELKIPVFNSLGTERLDGKEVTKEAGDLMVQSFLKKHASRNYTFEFKGNLFVNLDSGETKAIQMKFLQNVLLDASKYKNIFLFTHHSAWFDERIDWFKTIHPLIARKVKYVFGSDKNYLDFKKVDDVTYLTTGAPPCRIRKDNNPSNFFNFLMVDVKDRDVSVKVVPIGPIPIEHLNSSLEFEEEAPFHGKFSLTSARLKCSDFESPCIPPVGTASIRDKILNKSPIIKSLGIKPGMDILEIGPGAGFFTFPIADALKGTGRVDAADIDPEAVKYLEGKAKEGNYKNLFPTLVRSATSPPSYEGRKFDIIFLSEVYCYLRHPTEYFGKLLPSLKPEGRLFIVDFENLLDFDEVDFSDFNKMCSVLIGKGKDYPVYNKLSTDVKRFLENWDRKQVPPDIRKMIVEDFNKLLSDRGLFFELMDYYKNRGIALKEAFWSSPLQLIVDENDRKLTNWLIAQLDANGAFDNKKDLTGAEIEQLRKLNRILLTKTFDITGLDYYGEEVDSPVYVKKKSVVAAMEKAGYRLAQDHDVDKHFFCLEFKK